MRLYQLCKNANVVDSDSAYVLEEALRVESVKSYKGKLVYTLVPANEFTKPFTKEYKTVLLDEIY